MKKIFQLMAVLLILTIIVSCKTNVLTNSSTTRTPSTSDNNSKLQNNYLDNVMKLLKTPGDLPYLLSPDGQWLVSSANFSADDEIIVYNVLNKDDAIYFNPISHSRSDAKLLSSIYWSPDSQAFAMFGSSVMPPYSDFIVIFDISDIKNPDEYVFNWGYKSTAGMQWTPDGSRILIYTYPERSSFVVSRNASLVSEFSIPPDQTSGAWISNKQYAVARSYQDLWITDVENNVEIKMHTFSDHIESLCYFPEKNFLLLISEGERLSFIVFDLSAMKEVSRDTVALAEGVHAKSYSCTSGLGANYSGVYLISELWVFDWTTLKVKSHSADSYNPIWSPIMGGFLLSNNGKDDIKLYMP
jgi:hypothetical protein